MNEKLRVFVFGMLPSLERQNYDKKPFLSQPFSLLYHCSL